MGRAHPARRGRRSTRRYPPGESRPPLPTSYPCRSSAPRPSGSRPSGSRPRSGNRLAASRADPARVCSRARVRGPRPDRLTIQSPFGAWTFPRHAGWTTSGAPSTSEHVSDRTWTRGIDARLAPRRSVARGARIIMSRNMSCLKAKNPKSRTTSKKQIVYEQIVRQKTRQYPRPDLPD